MDTLLAIGAEYGIPVIEDAAEAIGSVYQGKQAGSMGIFGSFSVHGTKTITTGEGGMFVTNDDELYERVLTLSNHGRARSQKRQFWPDIVGFKYKMSNIQAAIGCAQVERIDELVGFKRQVFVRYRAALADLPLTMNPEPPGTIHGAWMPTVVFSRESAMTRERMQAAFATENVDARVFFWPLSSLKLFDSSCRTPIAHDIPTRAINLPSPFDLTPDEQNRVVQVIRHAFRTNDC